MFSRAPYGIRLSLGPPLEAQPGLVSFPDLAHFPYSLSCSLCALVLINHLSTNCHLKVGSEKPHAKHFQSRKHDTGCHFLIGVQLTNLLKWETRVLNEIIR